MPADSVVIRLPGPRALRVLARSVLFAVALLCLPWLRTAEAPPARGRAVVDTCAAAAAQAELLLRDLRQEGLLAHGARAVVLGADGDCDPKQGQDGALRPVSLRRMLMIGDASVDFLLDFGYFSEDADRFAFADRVLKHGGILAAPVDSLGALSLPQNYRVTYIHRFAEEFVGVKKIAPADDNSHAGITTRTELSSPPCLKEGVIYSQRAETTNGEFKNLARKLLLSDDDTGTPTKRKVLVQMLGQDQKS